MKRIVCYCLAVSMIPLYGCPKSNCTNTEPQLLVKDISCNRNLTALVMFNLVDDNKAKHSKALMADGCPINFHAPINLNDTFYLECETEKLNCFDEEEKITQIRYYIECEDFEKDPEDLADIKDLVDGSSPLTGNSGDIATILGSSVGAMGATVLLAYGAYKLKSFLQSGTYLFPDTPGFNEP